jgi:Zn-finger nucleic acid-binding protein
MDLVVGRRYFRCSHCGSYGFPEGADSEGIRTIGDAADSLPCPVCSVRMFRALLDNIHPVDVCNTCRGVLMPRDTFAGVINARRAWASSPPAEPVPFDRAELQRALSCPKCGGRFQTYPHFGPGNVVIDSCTTCDLVWLDFGEMRTIVDAPGRDRGSQRVPRIDDQFVRHGAPRSQEDEDGELEGRHRKRDVLGLLFDLWLGR